MTDITYGCPCGRCHECTHPWDDHDLSTSPPTCKKPRPTRV